MKKLLYNPLSKIIALILLFVMAYSTLFCGFKCMYMESLGCYSDEFYPYRQLNDDYRNVIILIRDYIHNESKIDYQTAGREVLDNVTVDGELRYPSDLSYNLKKELEMFRNDNTNFVFAVYFDYDHSQFNRDYMKLEEAIFSNVLLNDETTDKDMFDHNTITFNSGFIIRYGYDGNIPVNDKYAAAYSSWQEYYASRYTWIYYTAVSALAAFLLLILCLCQAGKRTGDDEIHLMWVERIPLEIALGVKTALFIIFFAAFWESFYWLDNGLFDAMFDKNVNMLDTHIFELIIFILLSFGMAATALWALRSFIKRSRAGGWYRNTLCYMILRFCWRVLKAMCCGISSIIVNTRITWKWTAVMAVYLFLTAIAIGSQEGFFIVLWIFLSIILVFTGYYYIIQLEKVRRGTEVIASGDIDSRIPTDKLYGSLRRHAETLNHISDSIDKAVAEQMKSERMRTELITNVSHDLKTPLTSIISYVDLIKKENPENESIREYIDVLDRQSRKLKKLTEDLLEASKASSGTIATELSETNAAELLTQAAGEYTERFAIANIIPVLSVPEDGAYIMADGRHMWRVFDNLCGNICKYSLARTRAYLTCEKRNGDVVITFRNISSEQLCIPADSLTERFVRGDSSRHTEGSGLGLAIAKSLVELQKGSFDVTSDGDLFKVVLIFKECKPVSVNSESRAVSIIEESTDI
ncbi:MAG: HAMP domain-containing histidine kinase [Clostridiales bacterium]|nr:HAMP domain-containing histidine kinase [Clostridiales bacterium]